jgi:protocatechuate 3,4-dioxygenase beta subunit
VLGLCVSIASADLLTGKVVGPDERPIINAEVLVVTYTPERVATSVRTDASGSFSANAKPSERVAIAYVCIDAPGFAFGGGYLRRNGTVFHLQAPSTLAGSVVDRAGQPVAGAPVFLQSMDADDKMNSESSISLQDEWHPRATVRTDANGEWRMTRMLPTGTAVIALDDDRFVRTNEMAVLAPAGARAKSFAAIPGATIKGKAVYDTGGPASGAQVYAGGKRVRYTGRAITGADGSYEMRGMGAGEYTVYLEYASHDWVAEPRTLKIAEGQTLAAPDFVLTHGGLLEGIITDPDTGAAAPNILVVSDRSGERSWVGRVLSDPQGRYRLRVLPGENHVRIQAYGTPYLQPEEDVTTVVVTVGETKRLDLRIKKGLSLTGFAMDENGHPVAGARLSVYPESGGRFGDLHGDTDEAGSFTIVGLGPGHYTLRTSGKWWLVGSADITVPSAEPLKVVLRKVALVTLQGRVLSVAGDPLAGVTLQVQVSVPTTRSGGEGPLLNTSTDAQGRYPITGLRPDATIWISQPEKPGYKYLSGGAVTKQGDAFQVSDIVLAPLGGKVEGRVVDGDGKPVAGATVICPDGDPNAQVITGGEGRFSIGSLPPGEVTVVAVNGKLMGQTRAAAGGLSVQITISMPQQPVSSDVAWGFAILEEALRKSGGAGYYARRHLAQELAPYDPDFALRLVGESGSGVPDDQVLLIVLTLLEVNPERALDWAPPHLAQMKDSPTKAQTASYLGLAAADRRPELARQLHQEAKAYYDRTPIPTDDSCSTDLLTRSVYVALAGRMKDPRTGDLMASVIRAAQDAESKLPESERRGLLRAVVEGISRGGPELAQQAMALAQLPEAERGWGLIRALQDSPPRDPQAARAVLKSFQPVAGDDAGEQQYAQAAKIVIEAVGDKDPAWVLEVARKVNWGWMKSLALATAARYQDEPAADQLFREAEAAAKGFGWKARVAAMAYDVNPRLGEELFTAARIAAKPGVGEMDESVAEFAFQYARIDPAESRLLIEREYASKLAQGQKIGGYFELVPLVLAMTAVDVERALEMARALPVSDSGIRFDAQRKIAQYVLAPESVRRTLAFDRWRASDTWIPGTPTGW